MILNQFVIYHAWLKKALTVQYFPIAKPPPFLHLNEE